MVEMATNVVVEVDWTRNGAFGSDISDNITKLSITIGRGPARARFHVNDARSTLVMALRSGWPIRIRRREPGPNRIIWQGPLYLQNTTTVVDVSAPVETILDASEEEGTDE